MELIIFSEKTIKEFIKKHNKGYLGKDYEFLIAVLLCRFYEDIFKATCSIGFKLKNRYSNQMPNKGRMSIEQVAKVLREQTDEYTLTDVVIIPSGVKEVKKIVAGQGFQIKRFKQKEINKDTASLVVDYLESLKRKYAKSNNILLIFFESPGLIDFNEIKNKFNSKDFPFIKVMFFAVADALYIGEIWPNSGMNRYTPETLK